MDYNVVVTIDAEKDMEQYLRYLIFQKENKQAAQSVLNDFEDTKKKLSFVADSLQECENPRLRKRGYRCIRFLHHRYFMLYRIEGRRVFIDRVFHELQDYENKMK